MDINTLLSERMTFNNFLFSMSFPDIVNYLEKNPSAMSKVEWDLFTNSKIRTSKNIDSYPELILKHSNWPWRFNISQIQNELSRKISELSRLSKPSVKPMSSVKIEKDNWIDKVINSMEKLCEIQNKIKIQDSQIIINEIKKEEQEIKREREKFTGNIAGQQSLSRIISEEMPPEDPISFSDDDELEDEELEEDLEEELEDEELEDEELEDEELEDEELEDEELEYEFFSPF